MPPNNLNNGAGAIATPIAARPSGNSRNGSGSRSSNGSGSRSANANGNGARASMMGRQRRRSVTFAEVLDRPKKRGSTRKSKRVTSRMLAQPSVRISIPPSSTASQMSKIVREIQRKSNKIDGFVVKEIQKMKDDLASYSIKRNPIKRNDKRRKNEKVSNETRLAISMRTSSMLDESAMTRSVKGSKEQVLRQGSTEGSLHGAANTLNWFFISQAIESHKRFELKKIERMLMNNTFMEYLRRSSYFFMDEDIPRRKKEVKLVSGKKIVLDIPERVVYHKSKFDTPEKVRLEGFANNKIYVSYSLTPVGVILLPMLHPRSEQGIQYMKIDLGMIPQYYMLAKYIQKLLGKNYPDEKFKKELEMYLSIQSNELKLDLYKKNIVSLIKNKSSNTITKSVNRNQVYVRDNEKNKIDDYAIGLSSHLRLLRVVSLFFASIYIQSVTQSSREASESHNIQLRTSPLDEDKNGLRNMIDYLRNRVDGLPPALGSLLSNLLAEADNVHSEPARTFLKISHGLNNTSLQGFKNFTKNKIEGRDFKRDLKEDRELNNTDVKNALSAAVSEYTSYLFSEFAYIIYYFTTSRGGQVEIGGMDIKETARQRDDRVVKKDTSIRNWEEVLLVMQIQKMSLNVKERIHALDESKLKALIRKGDESSIFTTPYIDRYDLLNNTNVMDSNNSEAILSKGILVDDTQFVFDYVSRHYLTPKVRTDQYVRYLKLLSKYSDLRTNAIKDFLEFGQKNNEMLSGLIVRCESLILRILEAINDSNELLSKRNKSFSFVRHLGGNGSVFLGDKSFFKNFQSQRKKFIYTKFEQIVVNYIEALENRGTVNNPGTFYLKVLDHSTRPPKRIVVDTSKSYRSFHDEFFTYKTMNNYQQRMNEALASRDMKRVQQVAEQQRDYSRQLSHQVQEQYFPAIAALHRSGFVGGNYKFKSSNKQQTIANHPLMKEFKRIYNDSDIVVGDFLQLVSGMERSKFGDNSTAENEFQEGRFHHEFGLVFSPFLPAYEMTQPVPSAKPFNVIRSESLTLDNFSISWPIQLYGDVDPSNKKHSTRLPRGIMNPPPLSGGHFRDVPLPNEKYFTGFGEKKETVANMSRTPFPVQSMSVSVDLRTEAGSVPRYGFPHVTYDQFEDQFEDGIDKRLFSGQFRGLRVRKWQRTSPSNLKFKDNSPLENSSLFTFKFDHNSEDSVRKEIMVNSNVSNVKDLPTTWRTDHEFLDSHKLFILNKNIDKGNLSVQTILKHTKKVQSDIIKDCVKTAKLIFPTFTWQNIMIMEKTIVQGENEVINATENVNTPQIINQRMKKVNSSLSKKYISNIVKQFFCSNLHVIVASNVWCAAMFLPHVPRTGSGGLVDILTREGLNVYYVKKNSGTNDEIYMWLPAYLAPPPEGVNFKPYIPIRAGGHTYMLVSVDGEQKVFYKETRVFVQESSNGFILTSCSWFAKSYYDDSTSDLKRVNTPEVFCSANKGKIDFQIKNIDVCFFHNDREWPQILELLRLSSRSLSKAIALHNMLKELEDQVVIHKDDTMAYLISTHLNVKKLIPDNKDFRGSSRRTRQRSSGLRSEVRNVSNVSAPGQRQLATRNRPRRNPLSRRISSSRVSSQRRSNSSNSNSKRVPEGKGSPVGVQNGKGKATVYTSRMPLMGRTVRGKALATVYPNGMPVRGNQAGSSNMHARMGARSRPMPSIFSRARIQHEPPHESSMTELAQVQLVVSPASPQARTESPTTTATTNAFTANVSNLKIMPVTPPRSTRSRRPRMTNRLRRFLQGLGR